MQILQFVTQPASSLYHLYNSDRVSKNIRNDILTISSLASFYGKALPSELDAKIRHFVTSELKIDADKLIFRIVTDLLGPAGTKGSVRLAKGIICLSPEFVDELKVEFKASHKFTLAHELGHLHHDDNFKGAVDKEKAALRARLVAYTVVVLAAPFIPTGMVGTHFLGCTVAKCADLYMRRTIQLKHELRADRFAAAQSPEIAAGGIDTVHQLQQHNLDVKKKWLSAPFGLLTPLKKLALNILITSSGDIRFLSNHPPGQTRLDQITSERLKSKS